MKFNREHRLTHRPDFVHCYDAGHRFFSQSFVLFAVPRDAGDLPWRLGLAVTKKTGSAVWRNRVRRLLREVFRLEQAAVPQGFDLVVVPKRSLEPRALTLHAVRQDVGALLGALSKKHSAARRKG